MSSNADKQTPHEISAKSIERHSTGIAHYDLCVIGGGINGAGIARDAAGRGLSVLLVEAQDLAAATSSSSTKLIHGGLRYLEYYEFRLVHKALKEREVLLSMAPHIMWPLEFILPHELHLRPAWLIRCGLYLYDFLAGRSKLPRSRGLNLRDCAQGEALKDSYSKGFSYADGWVDDARLVVLNAIDAAARGATILTRTACTHLTPVTEENREKNHWDISLQDLQSGETQTVTADAVVNAAGPWVRGVLDQSNLATAQTPHIRLVKGSHIILKKRYSGDHCYIMQQPDKRIVFAIPYEGEFTLVGTTDVEFEGDPVNVTISEDEIDYLLNAVNRSLRLQSGRKDIVSTYSGVRPLFDDGGKNASAVTRDYHLTLDKHYGAPLLSVFGGKITTYRVLAEQAVNELSGRGFWTKGAALPGGAIQQGDMCRFLQNQIQRYPALHAALISRYARLYGTRMDIILEGVKKTSDLGRHFGDDLYQAEIDYLMAHEWAQTAEDVLWRRTKCGLHCSADTAAALAAYMGG